MESANTARAQPFQGFNMNKEAHQGSDHAASIFRLYMGGNAVNCWYLAMTEPRSMLSAAANTDAGLILTWLMLFVGLAALADVVINDFLPRRFHWRTAVRQRHFIFVAMAFCYVAQLYVAFASLRSPGLLMYYLWNAVTIMFIAFVDAHQRSKDATCVVICS